MKVLVDFPFTEEQVDQLRTVAERNGGHELVQIQSEEEGVAVAADVEVVLGDFKKAVCEAAPNLKWMQTFSAGLDGGIIYEGLADREGVLISNMAGEYAAAAADHAWALYLALVRKLHRDMPQQWRKELAAEHDQGDVVGGTLGVIGCGGFGVEMAKRALGYDMRVVAVDSVRTEKPDCVSELRSASKENLHSLLERSDVVMVATPITPETYRMLGAEELARMKTTAYLINVARGGIIDEEALAAALKESRLAGAGLDVCEIEPLPADSPLWDAPNFILTPHVAGWAASRPQKMFEFFCANLERYLTGQSPLHIADPKRGF